MSPSTLCLWGRHTRGELVDVAGGAAVSHGIVFDTPSRAKVVVAVSPPAEGQCSAPFIRTL